eukprot:11415017-Prorocentrum_lima.AAC.1
MKRRTPDPWNNVGPGTPTQIAGVRRVAVVAARMAPTIQPRNLSMLPMPELTTPPSMSTPGA